MSTAIKGNGRSNVSAANIPFPATPLSYDFHPGGTLASWRWPEDKAWVYSTIVKADSVSEVHLLSFSDTVVRQSIPQAL